MRVATETGAPYRCGPAARWLPRVLAASVLIAATLAAFRLDASAPVWGSRQFRGLVVVVGALIAVAVIRKAAEVQVVVRVHGDRIDFSRGGHTAPLGFEDIAAMRYEPVFAASGRWLPAAVLASRDGRSHRLSTLLQHGERLMEEILDRSEREDLRAWIDVMHLRERMSRPGLRTAGGYAVAGAILVAAVAWYLH